MEKSSPLKWIIISLVCLIPYSQISLFGIDFLLAKILYVLAIYRSLLNLRKFKLWYLAVIIPSLISYLQSSINGMTSHENIFIGTLNLFVFFAISTVQIHKFIKPYILINTVTMILFVFGIGVDFMPEGPKFMSLNQNLFSLFVLFNLILVFELMGSQILVMIYLILSTYCIVILASRYTQVMLILFLLLLLLREIDFLAQGIFKRIAVLTGMILCVFIYNRLVGWTANDFYALSSRSLIWALVIEEYNVFSVIGYGQTTVINFVSQSLATDRTSIHNVVIEIVLSSGLVGLFFFGSWVVKLFYAVGASKELLVFGLVSIFGYLLIGQFYEDLIVWILVAIVYDVSVYSRNLEVRREGKTFASLSK